jgi:hypothetical protein
MQSRKAKRQLFKHLLSPSMPSQVMYEVSSISAKSDSPEGSRISYIIAVLMEACKPFLSHPRYSFLEETAGLVHEPALAASTLSAWGVTTMLPLLGIVLRQGARNCTTDCAQEPEGESQ